jgi:O-antigen ligase
MIVAALHLGLPLAAAAAVFSAFLIIERRGRGELSVLMVLAVVVLDVSLYGDTLATGTHSIFHLAFFGQNFRLSQVAIVTALMARIVTRGFSGPRIPTGLLWLAFFAWVAVCAAAGISAGHPTNYVLRQAMIIVQVGGGLALAATSDTAQLLLAPELRRFIQACGVLAALLFAIDLTGRRVNSSAIPLLPFVHFGVLGADAATVFGAIGTLGVALLVVQPAGVPGRFSLLLPSLALLLSHLGSPQRAARLGLYVGLAVLAAFLVTRRGRSRTHYRPTEAGLVILSVGSLLMFVALASSIFSLTHPSTHPLLHSVDNKSGLGFNTRSGSIQSRFNQWEVARQQILSHPIAGVGLGGLLVHFDEGTQSNVVSDISHNIALDLLRRTGVVGLCLGAAALMAALSAGLAVWRRHPSDTVAVWSLACLAVIVGIVTKGMVESVFEKYRLATVLGLMLGMMLSAAARLPAPVHSDDGVTAGAGV